MKFKKFTALLLAVLLVLSLAACGTKDNEKKADMSSNDSAMTDEPKNAEEALALHKKLMEQENTILSQNTALWEKVFMEADKGMAMVEDGKNYGEFLLDTIESAKDQFTDEEYEMLKESATEISNIENKLTELYGDGVTYDVKNAQGDMSTLNSIASELKTADYDLVVPIVTPATASRRAARTHRNANTLLLRNGEFRCTILGPKTVPVHPLRSICPMRCCRASTAPGSLQTRLPVLLPLLRFVMGLLYHALQHVTRLYFYEFLLYH